MRTKTIVVVMLLSLVLFLGGCHRHRGRNPCGTSPDLRPFPETMDVVVIRDPERTTGGKKP